jgi:arginine decarboxylase
LQWLQTSAIHREHCALVNSGFRNTIPVIDNREEVQQLSTLLKKPTKIGIRIAAEEEPKFEFYTSAGWALAIKMCYPFMKKRIQNDKLMELKMLHFFINTGINDNAYYWSELLKCVNVYVALKENLSNLDSHLILVGVFQSKIRWVLNFDYEYMADRDHRTN